MVGYGYNPDAMRKAAQAATTVGQEAAAVDLSGVADMIGKALPGAYSVMQCEVLGQAWKSMQQNWARAAAEHGQKLSDSRGAYHEAEQFAEGSLQQTRPW
ncbi:hypothetical protein JOF53_000660 [Crossiella equi]|uniref:Phasin protein n=1 Tax=Crossiella equi TaxID=130796 RepID=A0ABS5A5C5_9PSEU|nr:hypothetical protein [Crossiella equi]MBP2471788.1 hypothetical protein [Crossiella equi]